MKNLKVRKKISPKWRSVTFKMPEVDYFELKQFLVDNRKTVPKLSLSGLIRRGIAYEMRRLTDDEEEYRESHEMTIFHEGLTELLREAGWERIPCEEE